jgi:molecular chaperone GrpE (heat shock protein)
VVAAPPRSYLSNGRVLRPAQVTVAMKDADGGAGDG